MTARVLIDAANLHSGGGLQVASSFLDELAGLLNDPATVERYPWVTDVDVEATPEVLANLLPGTAEKLTPTSTSRGSLDRDAWTTKPTHDVSFTVFGPMYGRRRGRHQIVGMADVTSIYSVPETSTGQSTPTRALRTVRRAASRALFTRADSLVVEAPHVRDQLEKAWGYPPERVHVVSNCVNAIFTADRPRPTERSGWIFVTRAYPHKNLALLGRIGEELARRGVTDLRFKVTLTDAEWDALDETTRRHCDNLGARRVEELPELYAACEGSVFPSLLECFSAAPLEALFSDLPLVASDRAFVRDVCGDAAVYVDPRDPVAWADALLAVRSDAELRDRLARERRAVTSDLPDARDRALAYLDLIDQALSSAGRR